MTLYFLPEISQFVWQDIETIWESVLPNWEDMIDAQQNYKLCLNTPTNESYTLFKLQLTSDFSNRQPEVAGTILEWDLALVTNNDRYTEWTITPNAESEDQLDMQGFWQYNVLASTDGINFISIDTGLTKVVNSSNLKLSNQPEYVGPNPDAESYIIYN